jgi:Tfp pilus assembly protein PilF
LLCFIFSCGQAREAERLIALAAQSEKDGKLETAADFHHKAAHLMPSDFDVQYRTAVLYLKLDNLDSEEHFKHALSLRPDVAQAHLNLGVIFLRQGNKQEGRRELLVFQGND